MSMYGRQSQLPTSDAGTLLAFFSRREEAAAALRRLRRKGVRNMALAHRTAQGRLEVENGAGIGEISLALAGALALGLPAGALLFPSLRVPPWTIDLLPALAPALLGALAAWIAVRQWKPGVPRGTLAKYLPRVLEEETMLVIRAPTEALAGAISSTRRVSESPLTVFVFPPEVAFQAAARLTLATPLGEAQIGRHASQLAARHSLGPAPAPGEPLLRRVDESEAVLNAVCRDLAAAQELEQGLTPSAEWILDNVYILRGHILDIRHNLPSRFYRELPPLETGEHAGLPRTYGLAHELVLLTDGRLDRRRIEDFLSAYQSVSPLTMAELWAVPLMLRIALLERLRTLAEGVDRRLREAVLADFWANRLLVTARRDPGRLFPVLAELARDRPEPTAYFASQLTGHLYDEEAALVPVRSWIERIPIAAPEVGRPPGKVDVVRPLNEIIRQEQSRQAAYQVSIGNAITSLRELGLLDWREVFESQSHTESALRQDPAGVYPRMDFDTRDRYRHAVEALARHNRLPEEHVAQLAVEMADQDAQAPSEDPRRGHVGVFLVGDERARLRARLGGLQGRRERVLEWIYSYHSGVYFAAIAATTALTLALVLALGLAAGERSRPYLALAALAALLPSSQLGIQVVNYLVTRLLPPRTLPKMSFETEGIPDEFRTLVVVPMVLSDARTADEALAKLEVRFLANPDANLLFALFSDFADAPEPETETDGPLLQRTREGIEELNRRHGAGRFYLFHRPREWSPSEAAYIGWERKRGKLEELNRLLTGEAPRRQGSILPVGDPEPLANVRFVITLDSDTQLPHGSARRMVETLAHPLNQPRAVPGRPGALGGYTILQPRISTALPSSTATLFSRFFTNPVGSDPYTRAVSDVYQDLSGEGSYHGKGIYDPRAFSRALTGRFPDGLLLSHDLLEGAHVRVALASDIELFDDFPTDYPSYAQRQHRWIRGDWQIVDWLLPRVPGPEGRRIPNPLSLLNRWKIVDNLRRSLLPASLVLFLVLSWVLSPALAVNAGILTALLLLFQPLARPLTVATTRLTSRFTWTEIGHDLGRSLIEAALLPHSADLALDAIGRVACRRWVSRRGLLEWETGRKARSRAAALVRSFTVRLTVTSLLAATLAAVLWSEAPSSLPAAAPFLTLWFLSPVLGWALRQGPIALKAERELAGPSRRLLCGIARRTWRYFDDFVEPGSGWLPPDNFQVSHQNRLAQRTSPTNIGLWAVSALAAGDFGYLSPDQIIERLRHTLSTVQRMEKYEGHLLNWYELGTLRPLEPRYVSSVDSGNLLACLWALEQGVTQLIEEPVAGRHLFDGLRDSLQVLWDELGGAGPASSSRAGQLKARIRRLQTDLSDPPAEAGPLLGRLRAFVDPASELGEALAQDRSVEVDAAYWAEQVAAQVSAWGQLCERYLSWARLLQEESDQSLAALGPAGQRARRLALGRAPSIRMLAAGDVPAIRELRSAMDQVGHGESDVGGRLGRVLEEFSKAQWLAGEVLAQAQSLIQDAREFAEGMNLSFLYDPGRRLFSVGYNVDARRLDPSFYDLLASEARLLSYIAIARGEIPNEHWLALNRPFGSVDGRRALLSWTGTMFEYLMPMLFQRTFPNSLLDRAARDAVSLQQEYARRRGVPWGMSESAYADLDLQRTYQYKAFGVPGLGLKRGLEQELVIAPYATMLALLVDPQASVANLERLAGLGLLGSHGMFEAIDFTRSPQPEGRRGVLVRAFMAHHQGMSFLALDNVLCRRRTQGRFHSERRVQASEPLLYERIPAAPPLHYTPARGLPPSRVSEAEIAPSVSAFDTPHSATPRVQLLGNGRYSLMVTSAGGGYSQWKGIEITRWRADTTRDNWGTFCYLRDMERDSIWSNTYHPLGGDPGKYAARFAVDRAEFQRLVGGIETDTEITVSPEEDVEVRRITLINRSPRPRRVEVTSYVELSLAPHAADRQHPGFQKLFVETEALPGRGILLAHRRARHPDEPRIFVAHRLTVEGEATGDLQFETDRARFLGRGRTLANPAGLRSQISNQAGFVLDPILSLRCTVSLEPGGRARLSLVLAAADQRDRVVDLAEKYGDPRAIGRALELAWADSQVELRLLRIQPDDARRFQVLAGHLLYPSAPFRPPAERLAQNGRGQAGLWAYGISGDLPLAVVSIGDERDLGLVRQMLQAHTYWRQVGLVADLVILNEEASGYDQPLAERLGGLIKGHAFYTGVDRPGGIYLRSVDQIPEEDLALILAVARIALVAARGPLSQQMAAVRRPPPVSAEIPPRAAAREQPSAQLPFLKLPYFNGRGGFTSDGREYAIYLGPGEHTPAPWVNVIANRDFGALVSESGSGFTWYGNSQRNRLTDWANDPVCDPAADAIYLRDLDGGAVWTPTASPIREPEAYRARHGAGYTVFEHNSHGIEQELVVFVPLEEGGAGDPLRVQRLRLRNDSPRPRRLSVTFYAEWTFGEDRERMQQHLVSQWDDASQALLAHNRYHPEYPRRVAFASLSPPPEEFTADRTEFLGRNRGLEDPAGVRRDLLRGRAGAGLDPCAALRVNLTLTPGQTREVICLLGQAESRQQALRLVQSYRGPGAAEDALRRTQSSWDGLLDRLQVEVPDLSLNFLLNRWLPYQNLSARVWGRSGLYQPGGAFGFRDQLQDVLGLLYAAPQLARAHILTAAGRQFVEGDVQHWWHPPDGSGVRSRISDDRLWLPYAVAHYVRVTGDAATLDEQIPFLTARPLGEEVDAYQTPEPAHEVASLYEHCRRAIQRGLTVGAHGLPLMGSGDWNDGMNRVGAEGRGESVWLAWFLVDVLQAFAELADLTGRGDDAAAWRRRARTLTDAVEREAWDGAWYRRAYFDDGTPLGTAAARAARIDSLPQSWAVLSGAGDAERARRALDSAWTHLVREDLGLVLLLTPPFDRADPDPGYIASYPPGVRENGGQYTHAAIWLAMAYARMGDADRAVRLLRMLNPVERARNPEAVERYRVEPYVVASDVYMLPGREGQGGWTWYTGSAGWMYRAWIEEILGFRLRRGTLRMDPVIPSDWQRFRLTYRSGQAVYEITVENPEGVTRGVARVDLDGRILPEGVIPLEAAPVKHKVLVVMGHAAESVELA